MNASGCEDEIVFKDGEQIRILRGTIISEDADFIHIQRRDGDWSIRKSLVQKIQRGRQ